MLEIRRDGQDFSVSTLWANRNIRNRFSGSVFHEGHIYGFDETILACVDAQTGERKWKGGRYGRGGLLLAGDHLIVLGEGGQMALVRASPEGYEETAGWAGATGQDLEPTGPRGRYSVGAKYAAGSCL